MFRDLAEVRDAIKLQMPLNEVIDLIDGKAILERVNDHLYKKRCDMNEHPVDTDGTRDSTASFTVNPEKELWYCFGCGTSGDRFEYASRKYNIDHIESIITVAKLQNFDLSPYYAERTTEQIMMDSLFKENDQARSIAHSSLLSNEKAMAYLMGRGFSLESIEQFEIGYAPPLTNGNVAIFQNIPNSVALQLDRKDQFNDAILFPITDTNGRMRYFQSRPFNPFEGMKYIGGRDSHPLYEETDRIFGFHIAKKKLRSHNGRLIGVEGAPDAIVCNQHGLPTCGFLGTVANQNTFDLLDRYRVTELVLLLDGDKAGRDRSIKISEKYITLNTKVRLKVAMLPDGYDPDEYINTFGVDKLKDEVLSKSKYAVQYLVDMKYAEIMPSTPTGKMDFMNAINPYMLATTDKMVRTIMVDYISRTLGFDPIQVEDYYNQSVASSADSKLYSIDGEEILLAEALRNAEFIPELAMQFKDDDWYLIRHRHLFRILRTSKHTDVESIFTTVKNQELHNIIPMDFLNYLQNLRGNIEFSLFDVTDKLMRRKTKELLEGVMKQIDNMNEDIVILTDKTSSSIHSITHAKADEAIFDGHKQASRAMQLVHERMKNPGQIIGYGLGPKFQKITQAWLGLQDKTFTVVAANQTVGKTQICENWALYQGVIELIPTLWFSLEMDCDRMTFRHLSILSQVPCTNIMTGNITIEEKNDVDKAAIGIDQGNLYISERGHDLSEALSIARRYVLTKGVKIIYVDYLQLQYISDRKTDQRYRELGIISKAWKQFAKEMGVAVVGISQLNKEALNAQIAKAEHGSGSYEIAQDADNYLTLKEKDEDEINRVGIEHGNITGNVDKNRMGERGILVDIYADRAVHTMMEV